MTETLRGSADLLAVTWRESPGRLVVSVLLMLAQSAAMPLAALAMGTMTDAAVSGDGAAAVAAALGVAVTVIASLTAGNVAHVVYFELGDLATVRMERDLARAANASAGIEHHERPEYADRIQVLREELYRAGWGAVQSLLSAMGLVVAIGITVVLLARVNPLLLLLPLAAFPPLLLSSRAQSVAHAARQRAAAPGRHARHLFGLVGDPAAAKEIRVGGSGPDLRARQRRAWDSASAEIWRGERRAVLLRTAGQLVFAVAYVLGTLLVVRDAVAGRRSVGDVVLVLTLAGQVNGQVAAGVEVLHGLQRTGKVMTDLRWVHRLLARQAPPAPDAEVPERLARGIELHGVSFTYPGTERPVLAGVDLVLPAGSTVAIVGENGAGKTTLVKLLCRFYPVTTGRITVDGVDLDRLPLDQWRQRIAAGFQDFVRWELVARQSVGVGDLPHVDSDVAVRAALDRARALDVLERLEHGLDTPLGGSYAAGTELSGGQWQKLALGRAMMREEPLLLVLDEPTSALDAQAEHVLFERYTAGARRAGRQSGAVTLLVSHRFSTVRTADLILVVDDGRISAQGTHDELMAHGGLYAELYALQAEQYA